MGRPTRTHRVRTAAAALAAVGALALGGCGMDVQTLQPDNNVPGVMVDLDGFKGRNLIVVADTSGRGVVSGSLVSAENDAITAVTAEAISESGAASPLTVSFKSPVELPANKLVVLSDLASPVTLQGSALKPGLTATIRLDLKSGKTVTRTMPVASSKDASLGSALPTASPTATSTP